MTLIIELSKDTYEEICESCKFFTEFKHSPNLYQTIANGKPYDKVIDEVTELLENEWGYEGMRDEVARIMKVER